MDFYKLRTKTLTSNNRQADIVVYPDFVYAGVKDLVCKGGDMYAFWENNKWNTEMDDMIIEVDNAVRQKIQELKQKYPEKKIVGRYLNDNETNLMKDFSSYSKLRKQSDIPFNTRIIFSNETPQREDYATNQLNFTPDKGECPAFDELLGLLYEPAELEKILWFIGAMFTNNMPKIQKFMFLYGGKGAGKGTVIKIFKMLFEGYYSTIDLMQLTSGSEFSTAQIKEVPLLIDDDSDISRISKDTNLLKLTAHEPISVNAKYKQAYDVVFNGLLITASNQRFQVRNIDSGITRRAVVVEPTNNKHKSGRYFELVDKVKYELPQIAQKAIDLFEEKGAYYYENYMDVQMAEATDYIFSFVRENAVALGDEVTLKTAAELFKIYLDDLGYDTKGYKRRIKNELMRYYREFIPQTKIDGQKINNVFRGLRRELIFPDEVKEVAEVIETDPLVGKVSTFDEIAKDYPAQLANSHGTPTQSWDDVTTTLKDIDTSKLHYVRLPLNHIVIDFDMKTEGEKDLEKNLQAARNFPDTYTELSKSGGGVHLHYIYDGDVSTLNSLYGDDVEIKVFTGKTSLRRKLTKFNEEPITHISTGLPMKEKEGVKVHKDVEIITWNEKKLRTAIQGNLQKKYHASTKSSMDFIEHIFKEAERQGIKYDLRDMRQDILVFASSSSNNSLYCIKLANNINYSTIDEVVDTQKIQQGVTIIPDEELYFYDIEVYPNLFLLVYKKFGDPTLHKLINPTPAQVEGVLNLPLIGFNNRGYDNHIMYAALLGEDNMSLYRQSQRIIDKNSKGGNFSGAYELSYADIYEYSSKKQSLKKWEIELGIKHDEMELPWDQPVPEEMWDRVAEYCGNDVMATEEVFKSTYADYRARLILSELSGLRVNATTTQHAAAFLFGDDPRPQDKFIYTDLSETFPGYTYSFGKSDYKGEDPGEGGYVYSEPGVYKNVALLDVESMHPNSLKEMDYFGPYTEKYANLLQTRLHIKHGDYDSASEMFGGILKPYLGTSEDAKALSFALKIIINIVYGMTSAKFDNKFKHKDNFDNIVAKRGALFMIDLKEAVRAEGYQVAHIKTDSIKIPDADDYIIKFVSEFGEKYGYKFEHEHTYKRMALVNKAVYIAQLEDDSWEATGSQFAEPFVYKKLFSKEPIEESDYGVTKQVKSAIFLDETFVGKVGRVYASKSGFEMTRRDGEKIHAVTGTKGFKWRLYTDYQGKEDIDMHYYDELVKDALQSIDNVGTVDKIVDDIPEEYHEYLLPF